MDETAENTASNPEDSAERILAVSQEIKKRRGRPPGSKNKPKDPNAEVGNKDQKKIFAGAIIALFSLLGIILGWFGYEYYRKLEQEEAERGAVYLVPIANKVGFIATAAFYLSFPIWLLSTVNESFRKKKVETPEVRSPAPNGVSQGQPGPSTNGAIAGGAMEPDTVGSPVPEDPGLSPLPPATN